MNISEKTFNWLRIIALALVVAGALTSNALVQLHLGTTTGGLTERLCGGPLDCGRVLQSKWAWLRIGKTAIPVAVLGSAYFTVMGMWLLCVGRLPGRLRLWWFLPAGVSVLSLAASVFFTYIMAAVLKTFCGLCLATHAANLPLTVLLWILALNAGLQRQDQPDQPAVGCGGLWKVPVLAIVAGLAIAVAQFRFFESAAVFKAYRQATYRLLALETDPDIARVRMEKAKHVGIPIRPDDPMCGPSDARHTVVVFTDFQCPACGKTIDVLRDVQKRLGGGFRLVFKYFPLNSRCNPDRLPFMPSNAFSCDAAAAAEAARRLGGNEAFWKMHDAIFAHQHELGSRPYRKLAKEIGLDPEQFERLWRSEQTLKRVIEDAKVGSKLDIKGTPAVFLDGRRIRTPVVWDMKSRQPDLDKTVSLWKALLTGAERTSRPAQSTQPTSRPILLPQTGRPAVR